MKYIHPFPARMAPEIALDIISEDSNTLRILDPMMGSGTVPAVARLRGHHAIGLDIDPLAVLIAKVWTTAIDPAVLRETAAAVLTRAKIIFAELATRDAYPCDADEKTKKFIRYWFDPYSRRQLISIAQATKECSDGVIKDALWCAFSRLIVTKQSGASRARDLAHSRPHRTYEYAPAKPFNKFFAATEVLAKNCIDSRTPNQGPVPIIKEGDARAIGLPDSSVDLVLTSPPYLNAIDYIRCSKFSLVWMGYNIGELRDVRSSSVGAEAMRKDLTVNNEIIDIISRLRLRPQLPHKHGAILARYIDDMRSSIDEVSRVLTHGGRAVYVVGENTVKGTYIRNSVIISALARNRGLELIERQTRILPANRRYLPPPSARNSSASLDTRMRREVILTLTKPKDAHWDSDWAQSGLPTTF